MKVIILASGSKGNATYIETHESKILIDAGISYKRIYEGLLKHNILLESLDAIIITHEHIDHVMHLAMISKKTKAKIYMNEESFENLPNSVMVNLQVSKVYFIKPELKYKIGDIFIVPISLFHDTKSIYGYLIKAEDKNIAYLTDTGHLLEKYYPLLRQMETIIIESNHDVEMLLNSKRDYRLKQRILSDKGHLSNEQCQTILKNIITENTRNIVLAHLSEECNDPSLAYEVNKQVINDNIRLYVASQTNPLEIDMEEDCA